MDARQRPTINVRTTVDPFYAENAYVVYPASAGPCWIIDPGFSPQAEQICGFVREQDLQPEAIVLTHAHLDHIAGIDDVRQELGPVPVFLAREEWPALMDPTENLSAFLGLHVVAHVTDPIDLPVGGRLALGDSEWVILDVSGHSPGGRAFYCQAAGLVIDGDSLFAGGVGRVDFPHSDPQRLSRNIRENLMSLPDETRVLPGHNEETTIGRERRTNPFILHGIG